MSPESAVMFLEKWKALDLVLIVSVVINGTRVVSDAKVASVSPNNLELSWEGGGLVTSLVGVIFTDDPALVLSVDTPTASLGALSVLLITTPTIKLAIALYEMPAR